jgi:hypothetical protein
VFSCLIRFERPSFLCTYAHPFFASYDNLQSTAVDDSGLLAVLRGTGLATASLNRLHDGERFVIRHLAEDNMAAVQPVGDHSGDEELRPIATKRQLGFVSIVLPGDEAYVLGPALAIESRPGRVCFFSKFSSANFSP